MSREPGRREGWTSQRAEDDLARAVLGAVETQLFENLYAAYHGAALRLATRLLADPEEAADAVHTAFLEMLRYVLSGRRWHDPGDAKAAVLRNTRWAALKSARRRSRRRDLHLQETAAIETDADRWAVVEISAICGEIVRRLSRRDRDALLLHYAEALTHAEAAARMGVSEAAFKSQLARAVRSARRVAHGLGVVPAMAGIPLLGGTIERLRSLRSGARRACRVAVQGALSTAAMAGCAISVAGVTALRLNEAIPSPAADRIVAHQPVTAALDTIDDAIVVDVIAVPAHPPADLVLALGRGRRCRCWMVFRSADRGATWDGAPGPRTVPSQPRLAVTAQYPTDPRIFVTDGSSGTPVTGTAGFGLPFAAVRPPFPTLTTAPRVADIAGEIETAVGRFQVAQPGGGRCSFDGGTTWTGACPASR